MVTEKEIKDFYKKQHDLLSALYYNQGEISKEEFDHAHGMIWADLDSELIVKGYKAPPIPSRDIGSELNELKVRVQVLELLK